MDSKITDKVDSLTLEFGLFQYCKSEPFVKLKIIFIDTSP